MKFNFDHSRDSINRAIFSIKKSIYASGQYFFAAFLILFSCYAKASLLNIDPVLLTITNQEPVAVLEVKNLSNDKVVMQADVLQWSQKEKNIITSPTNDLLISPPIFQLSAGQTQLLRVAWIKNRPLESQLTYRIILREIPTIHPFIQTYKADQLKIALLISIPVFIQPLDQRPLFQWAAQWVNKDNLKLTFNNHGNMTFHINQINLLLNNDIVVRQKTFAYVLPKHHFHWIFKIKKRGFNKIEAMMNGERKVQRVEAVY